MSRKHEALQFAHQAARLADQGDYSWALWHTVEKFQLNFGRDVLAFPKFRLVEHENVFGGDAIYVLLAEDKDGITHVWSQGPARSL